MSAYGCWAMVSSSHSVTPNAHCNEHNGVLVRQSKVMENGQITDTRVKVWEMGRYQQFDLLALWIRDIVNMC